MIAAAVTAGASLGSVNTFQNMYWNFVILAWLPIYLVIYFASRY